jgi:hypothetical protein
LGCVISHQEAEYGPKALISDEVLYEFDDLEAVLLDAKVVQQVEQQGVVDVQTHQLQSTQLGLSISLHHYLLEFGEKLEGDLLGRAGKLELLVEGLHRIKGTGLLAEQTDCLGWAELLHDALALILLPHLLQVDRLRVEVVEFRLGCLRGETASLAV